MTPIFYLDSSTQNVGASGVQVLMTTSVPEPSTWALMLLGFAALGYAGYHWARKPPTAAIG